MGVNIIKGKELDLNFTDGVGPTMSPTAGSKSPIWRPFTQMATLSEVPRVVRAKESKIFLENGRELIDAISSWWVITHGHCHPQIVQAVQRQSEKLDQVLFGNFSHPVAEELVDSLTELLPPPLKHFFFSDNGSTAVEVALKMAIQACQQRGEPHRSRMVSFEHAYHGDTVGAMSVSGRGIFTDPYKEMLFDVIQVKQGAYSTDGVNAYVEGFKEKMAAHGSQVAAVILEPLVQGAGGMKVWEPSAVREVVQVARSHGAHVIFDEVMTGFGRTGTNFAMESVNEVPDLLCLSKGLTGGFMPMALTVANSQVYECFLSKEKSQMFFHGHSFTANSVACAAALASSKLMKEPQLKLKWEKIESIHRNHRAKYEGHPHVLDLRVCGTIAAIELKAQQPGYESHFSQIITQKAMEEGVFLRPLGNILYILPPYCITTDELEQVWFVVDRCINELSN